MPYPNGYMTSQLGNKMIYDELNYDTIKVKENFNLLFQSLTVKQEYGRMFFLYGYGGTDKIHMWRTLTYAFRTTHSKFKIPIPSLENSVCNIHQGTELTSLLKQTKSLAKIMATPTNDSILFGGKIVVFGSDFKQILPRGRTTHSKFKIPIPSLENSVCNIHQGTELASLLKQTKLII
ncbi:hypothetical protein Lal_00036243 [Lupinus albus]|nr:hypothetical protein Lal_00036243 [Lupinus albus]